MGAGFWGFKVSGFRGLEFGALGSTVEAGHASPGLLSGRGKIQVHNMASPSLGGRYACMYAWMHG